MHGNFSSASLQRWFVDIRGTTSVPTESAIGNESTDSFFRHHTVDLFRVIDRIRQSSTMFEDIPDNLVHRLLFRIHEYPPKTILMEEGRFGDSSFYVLLRGKVDVSLKGLKIADFSGFQIFGEAGFVWERRIATVTVEEMAYLIQVRRSDVETFPMNVQMAFYRNLAREIARKMRDANHEYVRVVSEWGATLNGATKNCVREVKERVERML